MKTIILFTSFLLSFNKNPVTTLNIVTSELSFKITYHNLHLGYVKAVKQAIDETNTYTVLGRGEGDLLLKKIVSENYIHSVFEKDEFIKSTTFIKRNGKTLNNTQTSLSKGQYIISTVEKKSLLQSHAISFTVGLMYFEEPNGVHQVYSEAWGTLLPLTHHDNTYSFTIPDGTICTFAYKEGALVEVTSDTRIGEIKFTKE